jgi:hypothetical protein
VALRIINCSAAHDFLTILQTNLTPCHSCDVFNIQDSDISQLEVISKTTFLMCKVSTEIKNL